MGVKMGFLSFLVKQVYCMYLQQDNQHQAAYHPIHVNNLKIAHVEESFIVFVISGLNEVFRIKKLLASYRRIHKCLCMMDDCYRQKTKGMYL